eukprot:302408-Rhodomonas_salina.3
MARSRGFPHQTLRESTHEFPGSAHHPGFNETQFQLMSRSRCLFLANRRSLTPPATRPEPPSRLPGPS